MLNKEDTVFVLVDVQGNLAGLVHDKQALFSNMQKLIKSLQILNVPIIWVEQTPSAIGETIVQISSLLTNLTPISKTTFSAAKNDEFMTALKKTDRKQVLVAGIESHVCVYQTAMDLHQQNFEVEIISDAVSSRTQSNKQIALLKMQSKGLTLSSTEMALFELIGDAESKEFKQIIKIIK
ncbi:isochorismatase family protein [Thalassotalea psychrophila]|uniref:Isochorismatase family protein n=1 Tax=Thalassotalea psychrophila TaxID=3065647 RepID=A0ABY9TXW3_9GAMM|nr:isochorismatase family protein [Colwelliaceae bacterium SQ149]